MRLNLGLGITSATQGGPSGPAIRLSAASIDEDATIGSTVGTLSVFNGSGTYTFTLTADPDNKFDVSGANLITTATLDYDTDPSHSVTVQADNGVDDPITRTFNIAVNNVFEQPDLSALSGSFTLAEGAAQGTSAGSITGKTSGSTLSLFDDAGGRVQLSGTTIQAGATATDYETATSHNFIVRETLADSSNSPRDTTLSLTVTDVDEVAPTLSSPTDAANGSGAMTGSVSTNEGNGTLYWFISTSATPPSAANLKAGTGAVAAGSQAVSGTGTQNISDSGLSAETTYYTHFLHRDDAGNDSAIASADGFTTEAGSPLPTKVLAEGDSITATTTPRSYAYLWGDDNASVTFANYAVGGSGITSMLGRRDTALAFEPSHLTVFIGANDLSSDTSTYLASLYSYLAPFKALGSTIILLTVLPRNGVSGWETRRTAYNNLLRADAGTEFDYLVDLDDTPMGVDGAQNDTDLFGDGLHPTAAGQSIIKRAYATVLNYSLGIPNEPLDFAFDPVTDVAVSTPTDSASYTVVGLYPGETRPISITGGTYNINGGSFTSATGTVAEGDVVIVRTTSSADASTQVDAVLTIGTTEATFSVVTAGAGGAWTPLDLGSKLVAWYNPDGIAESDGQHVVTWSDASTNNNDAVERGAGKGPTVRAASLNGLKTVEFIGPNQEWMLPPSGMTSGRTASATFFVCRITTNPPATYLNGPIAGWGTNDGDFYPYSNGGVYSWYGRSTRIGPVTPPFTLDNWHVGMFLSAPSDWQYRVNGNVVSSTTSNTVAMGANPLIGKSWNGSIAEIVDVTGTLTTLERQQVEGYLAHKYNLQAGLDAGHPYKDAAP